MAFHVSFGYFFPPSHDFVNRFRLVLLKFDAPSKNGSNETNEISNPNARLSYFDDETVIFRTVPATIRSESKTLLFLFQLRFESIVNRRGPFRFAMINEIALRDHKLGKSVCNIKVRGLVIVSGGAMLILILTSSLHV